MKVPTCAVGALACGMCGPLVSWGYGARREDGWITSGSVGGQDPPAPKFGVLASLLVAKM